VKVFHLPVTVRAAIATISVIIATAFFAAQLQAQVSPFGRTSAPGFGSSGAAPSANPYSSIKGNFLPLSTTPSGESCITISPRSIRQSVNPNIVNHEVLLGNICGKSIKVRVCYFQTSACIVVVVDGYQKLERVLGIAPISMKDFRYEYRELF
jgi:hypothetical protein